MIGMIERYPDPAVRVLDPAFNALRLPLAGLERLWTGGRWGEGPVWFGDQRCLIWSDIPNNRMLRWLESTGEVDEFRKPSNNTNGNTRDREGRLISCEHLTGRVVRTEPDGRITVIAESYQGKRLNSPNDVVAKSDGSIWFTDPPFGLMVFYEGEKRAPELPHTNVYRVDGQTGAITCVADDVDHPNGLAFSPD
jgi:gluconolactonase